MRSAPARHLRCSPTRSGAPPASARPTRSPSSARACSHGSGAARPRAKPSGSRTCSASSPACRTRPTPARPCARRRLAHLPLMVVALARPEVQDTFPRLWADRDLQEVRLPALTKKAGEKLVRDLLGDDVAAATVHQIVDRSAGNAFFLEELIRA